jgi:hypothetical protein
MSPKVSRSLIWIPLKTDAHSAAMPSNCKVIVPQHGRQVNFENRSTIASASIQCQSSDYPSISTFYWKRFDRSPHLWYDVSVEIAVLPEWRPERSSRSLGGNLQSPTKIGELRLVSRPAGRLVSWIVLAENAHPPKGLPFSPNSSKWLSILTCVATCHNVGDRG